MKRTLALALLFAGCAGPVANHAAQGGYCSIAQPSWPAASRDYDRRVTLETIAALTEAARADRGQLKQGIHGEVGNAVDELYQHNIRREFISSGVAELANRLRQLDCAVRASRVDFAQADASYGRILGELAAERAALDPRSGT